MARLVVLKFENNDAADRFVESMQEYHVYASDKRTNMREVFAEVVGLFAFPTIFCEAGGCGTGRVKQFFHGPKYGWWVCARCGKPSGKTTGEKLFRQVVSQARNLIGDRPCEVASTFDNGWGAYGRR